uniref:Major facilitator superfamily domain-containing protein 6 n=2 Tax=Parasteatoda tepidariorum TaxID=114398 RepID=A0A2L2YNT3_PARTP
MKNCQINQKLLPVKFHYFVINAGMAGVMPFLAVYAMNLEIQAVVVGYVFAILSCVTFFSRPLIGSCVDYFQNLKICVAILLFSAMVTTMGLNAIPQPTNVKSLNSDFLCFENRTYASNLSLCEKSSCTENCYFQCSNNEVVLTKYNEFTNLSNCYLLKDCAISTSNLTAGDCSGVLKSNTSFLENNLQIIMWSIFTALLYISYGSITSLSDAACFSLLESKPFLYGKQRLWGTIGWGTFALLSGLLNQLFSSKNSKYNFSPGFYMLVVLYLIDVIVIKRFDIKEIKVTKNIFHDVSRLIIKPKIFIFIAEVYFVGVFIGLSRSYIFWYLRLLNADQLLLGCISLTQCFLGELPFFFFAGWFISKVGHLNTFTVSFVANAARFILYSFIKNPYLGLPIELLQGPAFGSFYSSMTSYAKSIAPEGTEATVQGIASGAFEGLGVATGSLLGGIGIRYLGASTTFLSAGVLSILCSLVSLIVNNLKTVNQ